MKTVYFNVLSRLSNDLSTKTPIFRFASKKLFFLAKNLIFEFCLLLSRGSRGGMKTFYFKVLSHLSNDLSTKKHPNFVLLAKIYFFLAKNLIFEFFLLLSRGIIGGMKTVYFNVLSYLSTELSTKTPIFRFASEKNNFFWQKN